MFRNTKEGYGLVAIAFHWAVALLVVAQVGLGFFMTRIADQRLAFSLIQLHKSSGFLILALMCLRFAWRLFNPLPLADASTARWEAGAATAVHRILYMLLVLLPLSGWALASASVLAIPTLVFGLFLVPHLPLGVSEAGEDFWRSAHHLLAYAAILLVAGHVLAALRHRFVLKDEVMRRMLFPVRSRAPRNVNGRD